MNDLSKIEDDNWPKILAPRYSPHWKINSIGQSQNLPGFFNRFWTEEMPSVFFNYEFRDQLVFTHQTAAEGKFSVCGEKGSEKCSSDSPVWTWSSPTMAVKFCITSLNWVSPIPGGKRCSGIDRPRSKTRSWACCTSWASYCWTISCLSWWSRTMSFVRFLDLFSR